MMIEATIYKLYYLQYIVQSSKELCIFICFRCIGLLYFTNELTHQLQKTVAIL
jgi:hypothetical protein